MKFLRLFFYITFSLSSLFSETKEVIVIGGGPAGLTAGIYSARSGLSTLVIEGEEIGGQIGLSYKVENYPGFPNGISGAELSHQMREQTLKFGAETLFGNVAEVDLSSRPFRLKLKNGKEFFAETLVIATGSRTKWLGLESESKLVGKGVNSCAICDGFLYRGKEVVVVGGGDTALEDALYLAKFASKVTLIHRRDDLRASKVLQEKAFQNSKIHFIYNTIIDEISDAAKNSVDGVFLKNVVTDQLTFYPCDGVFIAIGHTPNSELFKGQIHLREDQTIFVYPGTTKTTIPGVFAAGDVADPCYRQAIIAAGSGSMAAIDAFHYLQQNKK
jgi:thioredoxin reductase (NADPH)